MRIKWKEKEEFVKEEEIANDIKTRFACLSVSL
jgi:hypothetical protein